MTRCAGGVGPLVNALAKRDSRGVSRGALGRGVRNRRGVMRIVILGGGVVGVTTAYQLQRDGHEVEILERNGLTAAGTSWGNAGMIAPGHSFVWSSPSAPMTLLKSLVLRDQALRFKLSLDPRLYTWSWAFLKECTARRRAATRC